LLASDSAAEKLLPSPLVGAAEALRVAAEALGAEWIETTSLIAPCDRRHVRQT
jgi:hypothetical protein